LKQDSKSKGRKLFYAVQVLLSIPTLQYKRPARLAGLFLSAELLCGYVLERGLTAIICTGTGLPLALTRPGLMVCVSVRVVVFMK
jgi:hypothetical protein